MFGLLNAESETRGRAYMIWNFQPARGTPTLVAMNSGPAALETEELDDDIIIHRCLERLKSVFKQAFDEAELLNHHITRWRSNQYARGSYSYIPPGGDGTLYDTLAQMIQSPDCGAPIAFAGEHTCRSYPATVHGAIFSGVRAAKDILSHYGDFDSGNACLLNLQ